MLQCLWRSGQPVGVGSLLPTCRSRGLNSGLRGWWQVASPAECSPFIYSGNGPMGYSLGQSLHRLLRLHPMLQFWRAEDSMHRALEVFPGGLLCLEHGAAWLTFSSIRELLFLLSPSSSVAPKGTLDDSQQASLKALGSTIWLCGHTSLGAEFGSWNPHLKEGEGTHSTDCQQTSRHVSWYMHTCVCTHHTLNFNSP